MKNYPDVYYLPQWGELNAVLEHGCFDEFVYDTKLGKVVYPFVKREVSFALDKPYFDTVTPYGFNGPCIVECRKDKAELISDFMEKFNVYCAQNGIIAEYVRFSPWLKNAQDFQKYYTVSDNNCTFAVDTSGNFFESEFCSKTRNIVRKAQKNGLDIVFDFDGDTLDEFIRLYRLMTMKNHVGDYYKFSDKFLTDTFEKLRGNIFIVNILKDGLTISSALMLHYGNRVHYHLSGNDPEHMSLCGNSLLIYETCKWAHENGKTEFHLGGTAKTETGLFHFKQGFAKDGMLPFYVGKKIVNDNIYNKLTEMSGVTNSSYFPLYRG